jgi:hypothetical protein
MKKLLLICFFLCAASLTYAQLPPKAKVLSELYRICNGGQGLFQSWKGGVARNLGMPEYESMYTFPGTIDPRIKQVPGAKPTLYYYEATLAEGKNAAEIKKLLKDWEALLSDSTQSLIMLHPIETSTPDEVGLKTATFSIDRLVDGSKDAVINRDAFRVRLDYERQDDEDLYSAIIQIGHLK